MSPLEKLQRDLSAARRLWRWADVRRITSEIAAEHARLEKAAQDLPLPEGTGDEPAQKKAPKKSKTKKKKG